MKMKLYTEKIADVFSVWIQLELFIKAPKNKQTHATFSIKFY